MIQVYYNTANKNKSLYKACKSLLYKYKGELNIRSYLHFLNRVGESLNLCSKNGRLSIQKKINKNNPIYNELNIPEKCFNSTKKKSNIITLHN